ncbi:MAG TPA: hypothetical protein VE959_13185 [Bryobacteraceae bacterium]|nr:hypothetical protein [Bryobacteraceae bacterium]
MTPDPLATVVRLVSGAFERLGIAYLIGGSVASSARGIVRATVDIDIVARVLPQQAQALAAALGPDWYVEPTQIRDAILAGRSFNVIHMLTAQKVDIFPANDDFHLTQLARATKGSLEFLGETAEYPIATAEDILLAKLKWYRDGGEISDRQWYDIAGIVATNPGLDIEYLERWAVRLGVAPLLARALSER